MEHAQATKVAQAVFDACKRQVEKGRSLDNINLEVVIQRALAGEVELSNNAVVQHIQMQDIVGDYDTPDTVPEWSWVEAHASYQHRENGIYGIWEFVVNLARHFDDIPEKLRSVFQRAHLSGVAYLVFHQGT